MAFLDRTDFYFLVTASRQTTIFSTVHAVADTVVSYKYIVTKLSRVARDGGQRRNVTLEKRNIYLLAITYEVLRRFQLKSSKHFVSDCQT